MARNSSSEVTEVMVPSGDVVLNVATAGHGKPVLLLHGFPDSWHLWEGQIDGLVADGFRVIAPDLRGHGESSRPEDVRAYRMPMMTSDILAVLGYFSIERTAVVGHDWGAAVAWNFTHRHPELVDRLVALSVGHPGANLAAGVRQRQLSWYMLWFLHVGVAESVLPAQDWKAFRDWAWSGAALGSDPHLDRQVADLSRPGALAAALNLYRANIRPENYFLASPPSLPHVGCPVLGIWSADDPFLGEEQMTGSAAFVDGPWRYEQLPGGHWIPAQAPERLTSLLLDFLA